MTKTQHHEEHRRRRKDRIATLSEVRLQTSAIAVFAFANDRRPNGSYLRNLPEERRAVEEAKLSCQTRVLHDTRLEDIWKEFADPRLEGRIQVFHFAGHTKDSLLAFEDDSGSPVTTDRNGLAHFLGRQPGLVLVFLNACATKRHIELLRKSVPAVIGTTEDIDDRVAAEFASRFYTALSTKPLEKAFVDSCEFMEHKCGGTPHRATRELDAGSNEAMARWPWVLDCEERYKSWRLGDSDRRWATARDTESWSKLFEKARQEGGRASGVGNVSALFSHGQRHGQRIFRPWSSEQDTSHRGPDSENVTTLKNQGISGRFFGLYNLRPSQDKWVWIAWDALQEELVVVKELRPGCEQADKRFRIEWERDFTRKVGKLLRDSQSDGGVMQLVAWGNEWFASRIATRGSLQWDVFAGVPSTSKAREIDVAHGLMFSERAFRVPLNTNSETEWRKIQDYFVTLAELLSLLHDQEHPIVHRDLHPANLLIDQAGDKLRPIICDFDRAIEITGDSETLNEHLLRLSWENQFSPPERVSPVDRKSVAPVGRGTVEFPTCLGHPKGDVYTLAAILCDALLRTNRSWKVNPRKVHEERLAALGQEVLPTTLTKLLMDAMNPEVEKRPTAREFAARLKKVHWRRKWPWLHISSLAFATSIAVLFFTPSVGLGDGLGDESPPRDQHTVAADAPRFGCPDGIAVTENEVVPRCAIVSTPDDPFTLSKNLEDSNTPGHCVSGKLSNDTGETQWTKDDEYRLCGPVVVPEGHILVIEAGTRIEAEKNGALIVESGAKIEINGTEREPVVISGIGDEPGSWGGLVILGRGPASFDEGDRICGDGLSCEYGDANGDVNEDDSSGSIEHLRIERPGHYTRRHHSDNESVYERRLGGLTLAGVGKRTKISHVAVVDAGDDCFQVLGGNVDLTNLICHNFADDAFDIDLGYQGTMSIGLLVQEEDRSKNDDDPPQSGGYFAVFDHEGQDREGVIFRDFIVCVPPSYGTNMNTSIVNWNKLSIQRNYAWFENIHVSGEPRILRNGNSKADWKQLKNTEQGTRAGWRRGFDHCPDEDVADDTWIQNLDGSQTIKTFDVDWIRRMFDLEGEGPGQAVRER